MYLYDAMQDIDGPVYFVDNVVSTGTTLKDAQELIPQIKPLVFAVSAKYIFS
jgi:hypoxanthine phosphoribosyltransferase